MLGNDVGSYVRLPNFRENNIFTYLQNNIICTQGLFGVINMVIFLQ
jgi:hypothetical protein